MPSNKRRQELPDSESSFKMISACPTCGSVYGAGKTKTLKCQRDSKLVHATCAQCGGHFMAMMMIMDKGVSTIGMVTDLNLNDAKRLLAKAPITVDEAIEGYRFINEKFILK